jgi:hypothetical protein
VNGALDCVTNAHAGPFAVVTNAITAVMVKDDIVQGVDQILSSLSDVARRYQVPFGNRPIEISIAQHKSAKQVRDALKIYIAQLRIQYDICFPSPVGEME